MASLTVGGQKFRVEESGAKGSEAVLLVDGKPVRVDVISRLGTDPLDMLVRAGSRTVHIEVDGKTKEEAYSIRLNGRPFTVTMELVENLPTTRAKRHAEEGPITVSAPMAGRIASLKTSLGSTAEEGQALVVLEAMKMENEVASPKKGVVKEIYVQPGALVRPGDKLVLVE